MRFNIAALAHLVAAQLEVPSESLTLDARFVDDLGADPVQLTDLMLALEEHFEIEIQNGDAERLRTLQDVLDYLAAQGYAPIAD